MEIYFDHERLEVYQLSRELNREIASIVGELPRGAGEAGDNLRRAGASITRNIAEANGKWTAPDKANRYHIVRGSTMEVGAALDELVDFGFVAPGRIVRAKALASRIVRMIMGLIRSTESRQEPTPPPRKRPTSKAPSPPTSRITTAPRVPPTARPAGAAPDPDPAPDRDRR